MSVQGKYVSSEMLSYAIAPEQLVAIYDDDNDNIADDPPIAFAITRAEGRVDAYLLRNMLLPLVHPEDPLVIEAALEFLIAFSFERHPEYVRAFNEQQRAGRWARAQEMLEAIAAGRQRLPDESQAQVPRNLGGLVIDNTPRIFATNADGSDNRGDW